MRPLSVTDMRDALREVAERLQRAGVQGRLYVTGGAAMALAYDAERLTRAARAQDIADVTSLHPPLRTHHCR